MQRLLTGGALSLALTLCAPLALADTQATTGGGATGEGSDCRAEVSQLRYQIAGEEGLKEGDHELLAGLTPEEAGAPEENWFGSPPETEAMLEKLEEAGTLAADGDVEGCRALVQEVRKAVEDSTDIEEGEADG